MYYSRREVVDRTKSWSGGEVKAGNLWLRIDLTGAFSVKNSIKQAFAKEQLLGIRSFQSKPIDEVASEKYQARGIYWR